MNISHPNPERKQALEELVRLSNKFPHLRVMQLLGGVLGSTHMRSQGDGLCKDPYYLEDSALVKEFEKYEARIDEMHDKVERAPR